MTGLLPKRRTHQEIEKADAQLLRNHDAYFKAWLRSAKEVGKKLEEKSWASKQAPRKKKR